MIVNLIWLPQPVYSILENKAILIRKYLELSFQQLFICMIRSSEKKSAAVLIAEVLPAITNSELIFKISSSMVVLLLSFPFLALGLTDDGNHLAIISV
jgi:hypothetical protein